MIRYRLSLLVAVLVAASLHGPGTVSATPPNDKVCAIAQELIEKNEHQRAVDILDPETMGRYGCVDQFIEAKNGIPQGESSCKAADELTTVGYPQEAIKILTPEFLNKESGCIAVFAAAQARVADAESKALRASKEPRASDGRLIQIECALERDRQNARAIELNAAWITSQGRFDKRKDEFDDFVDTLRPWGWLVAFILAGGLVLLVAGRVFALTFPKRTRRS